MSRAAGLLEGQQLGNFQVAAIVQGRCTVVHRAVKKMHKREQGNTTEPRKGRVKKSNKRGAKKGVRFKVGVGGGWWWKNGMEHRIGRNRGKSPQAPSKG